MRPVDRTWLAVAVAGVLASLTLRPLTSDDAYLGAGWFLIVLVAVTAVVGDRLRLSKLLVTLLQVLLTVVVLVAYAITPGDPALPWWGRLGPLVVEGIDHMQVSTAPMPPHAGAAVILASVVAGMTLVAGVLADQLERPALALAPLATLFAVPAVALRTDVGFMPFVLCATGYLLILLADGLNADRAWTRNVAADEQTAQLRGSGVWRIATLIGVPAVALSIAIGTVAPTLTTTFFESLRPGGTGPIEMSDPQLDLRNNLTRPENAQVLTYTTDKPTGAYLRMTALPLMGPDGWAQSRVSLRQGALSPVPGVPTMPAAGSRTTTVQIGDFRSMYLPVPYAPRAQDAPGEWSHDPASLMVIATGPDRLRATENLSYTVTSWEVEPDGAGLSDAVAGTPQEAITAEVPEGVPQSVVQLTESVTASAATPALKAAAIQAYLRTFTYSVQGASGQTNYQAIETFLLQTKTGYCVQFAGSMALMARIAGIPSRVAVGFLPGTQSGDRWVVNTHDMHAWPELYFEGYGWVRFEPTPSVATPPPWTVAASDPAPTPDPTPEPTPEATPTPSAEPSASVEPSGSPTPLPVPVGGTDWVAAVLGVARVVGLVAAGLAVLALPWFVRQTRRARRLSDAWADDHERVAGAWAEVRDTWLDLGRVWPAGSARQIAGQVAAAAPGDDTRAALRRIVVAVERSRYAATLGRLEPLGADVAQVVRALESTVGWDGRLLARFRPVSLWVAFSSWWQRRWTRRPRVRRRPRAVRTGGAAQFGRPTA